MMIEIDRTKQSSGVWGFEVSVEVEATAEAGTWFSTSEVTHCGVTSFFLFGGTIGGGSSLFLFSEAAALSSLLRTALRGCNYFKLFIFLTITVLYQQLIIKNRNKHESLSPLLFPGDSIMRYNIYMKHSKIH